MTGVYWSVDRKLLVSTHGFPGNVLAGWGRPALNTHRHSYCRIAWGDTNPHAQAHTQTIRDLQRPRLAGSLFGALAQWGGPRDERWGRKLQVVAYLGFEGRQGKEEDGGEEQGRGCEGVLGDSLDSVRSVFSVSFVGFPLCIP